jgi:hypothetical protein
VTLPLASAQTPHDIVTASAIKARTEERLTDGIELTERERRLSGVVESAMCFYSGEVVEWWSGC